MEYTMKLVFYSMKPICPLSVNQCRNFSFSLSLLKKIQPVTKTKSTSSHDWLSRQLSDPFVELAKKFNYRCRSAFKLLEIDDKFKILQPGFVVVDCGASPGSWTQVAVQRTNADGCNKDAPRGTVVAIDKQLIYQIEGAKIFGNADFTNPESQQMILEFLQGKKVDSVISDMAPKATGVRDLDTENIIQLCYAALRFALGISEKGGSVVVKLWQTGKMGILQDDMKKFYERVKVVKPKSSRSDSTEIFLVGQGFKGLKNS